MKKIIAVVMTALILAALAVPAFAVTSPVNPNPNFNLSFGTVTGKGDVNKVQNADGSFTMTATVKDGETFKGWSIAGTEGVDYVIVSGSLTSPTLVIKLLKSDVKVDASFTGTGDTVVDNSNKSPATGTYTVLYVMAGVAALSVAVVAKKRISDAD